MSAIDDLNPVPEQPEISQGNKVFSEKAYILYRWMREKLGPAIIESRDLILNAVTGAFTSTSTSSFAIDAVEISITIGTDRSFVPGTSIRAAYVTDPTNYVDGIVKSYNKTTGALVFIGQFTSGGGTYSNWSITIIATSGSFASLVSNKFAGLQALANEVTIASASIIDLTAADTNQFKLTGTVPVTGATMPQGAVIKGRAVNATPLVNSGTFKIEGGADYTCSAGDWLEFKKDGDGNVHVSITTGNSNPIKTKTAANDPTLASNDESPVTSGWVKLLAGTGLFNNIQVFTASGTFTVPAGVTKVKATVVGGGGNGGNGIAGSNAGAGGGGAGTSIKMVSGLTPLSTISVTVGSASNASSFGTFCSASGGSNASGLTPGSGGIGSGGDLNLKGSGSNSSVTTGFGGCGGSSALGGGGNGGVSSAVSQAGGSYGGGGGGGSGTSGFTAGGAGSPGVVIVEW